MNNSRVAAASFYGKDNRKDMLISGDSKVAQPCDTIPDVTDLLL